MVESHEGFGLRMMKLMNPSDHLQDWIVNNAMKYKLMNYIMP